MTCERRTSFKSLAFSDWLRFNLPDSNEGQTVWDIDHVIWHRKTNNLIFIEEKCFSSKENPKITKKSFIYLMQEIICPALKEFYDRRGLKFGGFIIVQFEKVCPDTGKVYINGKRVTREELIKRLTLEEKPFKDAAITAGY